MRIKRFLLIALVAMLFIPIPARAGYIDTNGLENALPGDIQSRLDGISPSGVDVQKGGKGLLDSALTAFRAYLKDSMAAGFLILALCVVISLAAGFAKSAGLSVPDKVIDITAVCAILIICLSSTGSVITECKDAIKNIDTFSSILIPAFGIATAVAGKPVTAVASAGVTLVFTKVLISLALGLFIPAIYLYITSSAAGAMSDNSLLNKVAGFIKWLTTAFFRVFLTVFTVYLSMSGIISGSADAVAVKTAQVTISGAVPVVGGIISGISESLLAGAGALRSSIGIYGLLASVTICLAPFVRVLCHLLIFKLLAAFSGAFAGGGAAKVLDGISDAYSVALGLLGTCCAVQFISIVVSMVVSNT